MDTTANNSQRGYFKAGGRDLYGTVCSTVSTPRFGVMLLPPFGEERKSSLRHLVRLAESCAGAGHGVFRFDLSGTGDSGGEHGHATMEQWTEEALGAFDVAGKLIKSDRWCVLGTRSGGIPAARLCAARKVDMLCLLEPVIDGLSFLRDLLRRQQIKVMMGGDDEGESQSPEERWADGRSADLGGFEVGAELAAELKTVNLAEELQGIAPDCAIQLLRVSGGKTFPASWEPVLERVRTAPRHDIAIIREKPFWGQLEYYETNAFAEHICRFLDAQ